MGLSTGTRMILRPPLHRWKTWRWVSLKESRKNRGKGGYSWYESGRSQPVLCYHRHTPPRSSAVHNGLHWRLPTVADGQQIGNVPAYQGLRSLRVHHPPRCVESYEYSRICATPRRPHKVLLLNMGIAPYNLFWAIHTQLGSRNTKADLVFLSRLWIYAN